MSQGQRALTSSHDQLFFTGILTIVAALNWGDGLVFGRFVPDPWPSSCEDTCQQLAVHASTSVMVVLS